MERHQQIRMEQSSLRDDLEQKDIKIEDYVSQMTILNKELVIVEQKMYDDYDSMDNHIKIINTILTDVEMKFVIRSKKYNKPKDKELWKQKYFQLIRKISKNRGAMFDDAKTKLIKNINTPYKELFKDVYCDIHPFHNLTTILEIQIIIENGFDINTNLHDSHATLLTKHNRYDNITILEYLLDNGADINTKSTWGNPFIENLITYHCTLKVEYHKILKLILNHPLVKIDNIYLESLIVKLYEKICDVYKFTEKIRDELIFIINNYIEKNN
jgi:hypothetical protein